MQTQGADGNIPRLTGSDLFLKGEGRSVRGGVPARTEPPARKGFASHAAVNVPVVSVSVVSVVSVNASFGALYTDLN